jgi:hypothetical protein
MPMLIELKIEVLPILLSFECHMFQADVSMCIGSNVTGNVWGHAMANDSLIMNVTTYSPCQLINIATDSTQEGNQR